MPRFGRVSLGNSAAEILAFLRCGILGTRSSESDSVCPLLQFPWLEIRFQRQILYSLISSTELLALKLTEDLKLRVKELQDVAPSLRALLVWLIVFAFVLQTQVAGGHIHPPKPGTEVSEKAPSNDGHGPRDPRNDPQCFFCQQLSSTQPFVAAAAPEILLPLALPFGVPAPAHTPQGAKLVSFDWLSRAPPAV